MSTTNPMTDAVRKRAELLSAIRADLISMAHDLAKDGSRRGLALSIALVGCRERVTGVTAEGEIKYRRESPTDPRIISHLNTDALLGLTLALAADWKPKAS